ncbi:ABC transporter ATP-binding protein [Chromobacterium violaceum]|uniref:ABC transporter ATP-binding protein n=1 Tax=Chromobacterium violaceum TaxID=536 RepID=UPI001CE0AF9E|nr:ABC transporter ATP-binding protein [Chromobacterium violaceum]
MTADFGRIDLIAVPRVLSRLARLSLRYRWRCTFALSCVIGVVIFNIVIPKLLGNAVDIALHPAYGDARAAFGQAGVALIAACTLRGLFTGGMGYFGESISQRIGRDLRLAYFDKLQHLDLRYHNEHHSGDLIARGMLDLESACGFIETGVMRVAVLVLLVSIGMWRLSHVDSLLAVLALSFVPFVAWRAARLGVVMRWLWHKLQVTMADLTRGMEESLQGGRVVRAFAAQAFEMCKFDRLSNAALEVSNQRSLRRLTAESQIAIFYYSAMGAVLWVGTQRIASGVLSVGQLTEVLTFLTFLRAPVRQMGLVFNAGARAIASGARIFDVLDRSSAIADAPGAIDLKEPKGLLRFQNVSFAFGDKPVLRDISFEVRPGGTLGIVGAPGSGKSTVVQLIARFHDVSSGSVTLDGHDIRTLTLDSLRAAVGIMQQEVFLFDTSVYHNAAYADPEVSREYVVASVADAQLHSHVVNLPEGYDTLVGERGTRLSGGQRQRLAIARSFVGDPCLLVFDDATSALDTATEQALLQTLRQRAHHKTTVIVSHRLTTVCQADEILVLDAGHIVERGSHEELLARGGQYAGAWQLQHDALTNQNKPACEQRVEQVPHQFDSASGVGRVA